MTLTPSPTGMFASYSTFYRITRSPRACDLSIHWGRRSARWRFRVCEIQEQPPMSTEPYVSVIIPVYNSGPLLAETLQSVLNQTHSRLEIIVVDDGSTNHTTLETLQRYRSSIRLIQQSNQGVASARNAGLRSASGDYIAFIDHDDLWLPAKLEVQLTLAVQHGESGMIVCDGVQFNGDRIISERLIDGPLALYLSSSVSGVISGDFYAEVLECNPASCPAQTLMPRGVCE